MSENNVKENSDSEGPLTKVKGLKTNKLIDESVNETNKPENTENITITKPKKEKKPRSEKQKAQFQQVFNKRKEILEKKNLEKKIEASKLLLQHEPEFINKQKIIEPVTPPIDENVIKKKKVPKIVEMSETDNDSEESVIIIKKKTNKPKKKKKKIIIEESSDESSSSGEDEPVITIPKPKRDFATQQNKKSIVKIHEKPRINYDSYFC
jgi:hypothetical protein